MRPEAEMREPEWIAFAVTGAFGYFVKTLEKNPRTYLLTPANWKMGEQRLRSALAMSADGGNQRQSAKKLLQNAIDALAASEWYVERGQDGWAVVFGTEERFQKFLDWHERPPMPEKKARTL